MKKFAYIGVKGQENLRRYKYSGSDHSLISKHILQPFWSRFVLLFPLSVAPNTITLSGFAFIIASYIITWIHSPDLTTPLPRPVLLLLALFLFLYQTFDAVDGKQARRTGSSSPLGELMDHGCDAFVTTLEVACFAAAATLGGRAVLYWVVSSAGFMLSAWETFFTHSTVLPLLNAPTEGVLVVVSQFLSIAVIGPQWFWQPAFPSSSVPLLAGMPCTDPFLALFVVAYVIPTAFNNVSNARAAIAERSKQVALTSTTSNSSNNNTSPPDESEAPIASSTYDASPFVLLVPYMVFVTGVMIWWFLSPSGLLQRHAHLFFLPLSFSFALMVGRLLLSHLTGEDHGLLVGMLQPLAVLPIAVANVLLPRLAAFLWAASGHPSPTSTTPIIPEMALLLAFLLHSGYLYLHFAFYVTQEICDTLGIWAFRVKKAKS